MTVHFSAPWNYEYDYYLSVCRTHVQSICADVHASKCFACACPACLRWASEYGERTPGPSDPPPSDAHALLLERRSVYAMGLISISLSNLDYMEAQVRSVGWVLYAPKTAKTRLDIFSAGVYLQSVFCVHVPVYFLLTYIL